MDNQHFIERIRPLIGSHFNYLGSDWVLIEVLRDEQQLVLSAPGNSAVIQADLYGQASRRSPETLMIPLFGETEDNLSDELLDLLSQKQPPS